MWMYSLMQVDTFSVWAWLKIGKGRAGGVSHGRAGEEAPCGGQVLRRTRGKRLKNCMWLNMKEVHISGPTCSVLSFIRAANRSIHSLHLSAQRGQSGHCGSWDGWAAHVCPQVLFPPLCLLCYFVPLKTRKLVTRQGEMGRVSVLHKALSNETISA